MFAFLSQTRTGQYQVDMIDGLTEILSFFRHPVRFADAIEARVDRAPEGIFITLGGSRSGKLVRVS